MKIAIVATALFCCTQVSASEAPVKSKLSIQEAKPVTSYFTFVRGHRQGKSTTITWSVSAPSEVTSFDVYDTYEGDPTDPYAVWTMKGSMANGNSRSYKFTDNTDVYPGTMYYRVIAQTNNGPISSDFCQIKIVAH